MKISKLLLILCFSMFLFVLTSCNNSEEGEDNGLKETDTYLFKDGASDYKIIVPSNPSTDLVIASQELQNFFYDATGYTLPILEDKDLSFNEENHHISLGKTKLLAESGVEINRNTLGDQGYRIVTKGNTVLIAGGDDYGTQFGVYKFLEENLGWEIYAEDEIIVPKKNELKLLLFDYTDVPDMPARYISYHLFNVDKNYTRRMRLTVQENLWAYFGHSFFQLLPPSQYLGAHPDWYSPDGTQLCVTNEEMTEEMIRVVKREIAKNPNIKYFMIGQEDIYTWCTCEKCKEETELYGISGSLVRFMNRVSAGVTPWLEETYPGKDIKFVTFAYHMTEAAPVTRDAQGNYQPFHESVIPAENVGIYLAALHADYTYSITSGKNNSLANTIASWASLTDNLFLYFYTLNASYFYTPFYNYNAFKENYQAFKDMNIYYIYEQGQNYSDTPALRELHAYVMSKLMWDSTLNAEELVKQFIEVYYGPAAPFVQNYFDTQRVWFTEVIEKLGYKTTVYAGMDNEKFWPKALVDSWRKMLEDGLKALDVLKDNDELYEKYYWRVKREFVTLLYLQIQLHYSYYTSTELIALIDEFEFLTSKYEYVYASEAMTTDELISSWRKLY